MIILKDKQQNDLYFIDALKRGDKEVFAFLFNLYYKDLVLFSGNFIQEKSFCEDVVQSIFLKLWKDREQIQIESSLKSYLIRAVRNSCLDELRHREVIRNYQSFYQKENVLGDYDTENYVLYSDLIGQLNEALEKIPEKYREAFEMNRMSGLKYKEIAEKLSVSERTVEDRISKALQLLRNYLKEFITVFLFFIKYG